MFKFILRYVLIGIVVWFLKSIFEVILPFPTESMMDGLIDLTTQGGQKTLYIIRYVVWIFFLDFLIRYSRPIFSFLSPNAKRFSVTKPMRRVQGAAAEFFLFGISFIFIMILVTPFFIPSKIEEQAEKLHKDVIRITEETEKNKNEEIENAKIKREEKIKELCKIIKQSAKQNNEWLIHSNLTESYLTNKNAQKFTSLNFSEEKFFFPNCEGFSEEYKYILIDLTREMTLSTKEFLDFEKNILPRLRHREFLSYQERYKKHKKLLEEYRSLIGWRISFPDSDFLEELFKKNPIKERKLSYYKDAIWDNFKENPIPFIKSSINDSFPLILILSLILYALSHLPIRYKFAKPYESFIRFLEQSRFGLGGSSRFAGLFEEWNSLLKNQTQGLFLGRSLYNPYLTIGSEDPRHMITIAGSRAGKGTTAIIPNLLLWKHSVVVIDPKGTNAAVSARRRRELGQDVYLIDPFNIVEGENTASFDPLVNLDPNSPTIREEISIIAEALVVPDPEPKEKHWDDGAKTVIAGLIAHIISSDKIKEKSLFKIRELLSLPPDDQNDLWIDMMMNESSGRLAIDAASRMLRGKGTAEISSILSNADKHTEWLSSPAIQKALSSSTFDFSQLKEKRTTIYLILPPNLLETHNRFLRLFINLTLSQMSIGGRSKIPVLMLMDEFLALGRMTEVEKAFGLLAGYNLIMWPFIQDYGRLKDIYKNSVNAFINNSRAIQVFGVFDSETTRFASERLGNRIMDSYSTKIKNHRTVPLRSPSEVSMDVSAESKRQYIIRAGKTPLLIEKIAYYDNSYSKFKNLYDKDPDYKK